MTVNPYSAPDEDSLPTGPQFRCTQPQQFFLRVIAGRKREARFNEVTGEYELFQVGIFQAVMRLCLIAPITCFVVALFSSSPSTWIVLTVVAVMLGAILWFVKESVYFTREYVRRFGPCRRSVRIQWSDLQSLTVMSSGDLVLKDSSGKKIYVHTDLRGQRDFFDLLPEVVSPELLEQNAANLAELKKLVC